MSLIGKIVHTHSEVNSTYKREREREGERERERLVTNTLNTNTCLSICVYRIASNFCTILWCLYYECIRSLAC